MLSQPLVRHLTAIMLIKVIALVLIYFACFAPSERPQLTDRSIAAALFGPAPEANR